MGGRAASCAAPPAPPCAAPVPPAPRALRPRLRRRPGPHLTHAPPPPRRNSRTREFTQALEELAREKAPAAAAAAADPKPPPAVGDLPSAHGVYSPTSRGDAFTLSAAELAALQAFYGDDFEIGEEDTLRCRQDKFLRFVCA